MTLLIFIVVLLVTVTVHEWGHFIVAKKTGMFVEEFGIGIPPKIWSTKKGDTEYSLNALPIGGFVKIAGENGAHDAVSIPLEKQFQSKPWYAQAAVLIAGVVCNIALAFVLFTIANVAGTKQVVPLDQGGIPTVVEVVAHSPAEKAGIRPGDTITAITIQDKALPSLETSALRASLLASAPQSSVSITVTQRGVSRTVTVTPEGQGVQRKIGIAIAPVKVVQSSFFGGMKQAVVQIATVSALVWNTLSGMVIGLFTQQGNGLSGLTGPVGLVHEVGVAATIGITYLLAFTATISVNLAVLNSIPFPALDGGRLVIVLLEAITRRTFSPRIVGTIHTIGFILLLLLMLMLTVGDIRRMIGN